MSLENGNYKVPIPLPSGGRRAFSMHEAKEVDSFIRDVMSEDPSITNLTVLDLDGSRVSRSTPVEVLLRDDWLVTINDKNYLIRSPARSSVGDKYVSVRQEVLDQDAFKKIQNMVSEKAQTSQVLTYKEFLEYAEDLGVRGEQAHEIARALHKLGSILHFDTNPELKDHILLNPTGIAANIEKALDLPRLMETRDQLVARIAQLRNELGPLEETRERLMARAARVVDILAWSVLVFLYAQFALFARLTWWESSWDVMEPVTWITTMVETVIAGYLYYLFTRREYSNTEMRTALITRRFNSMARSAGFREDRYNSLKAELENLEAQIQLLPAEKK
jgi:HPt (histidine-containing phosphotransfer) domain-containing protein